MKRKEAWSPLEIHPFSFNRSDCCVTYIMLKNFLPVQNIEKFLTAIFTARF
jgi:hypothetical protein